MAGRSDFLESFSLIPDEDEIEQNYAYRERFEPDEHYEGYDPTLEARLLPEYEDLTVEEINSWISEEAHTLILEYEVGGRAQYDKRYCRPCWPGGASGVTIGLGYDLGYQDRTDIEDAWRPRLDHSEYNRLASTIGKKGATARQAVQYVKDIEVPWEQAFDVYQLQTVPIYAKQVLSIYPGSEKIHPHCFGALLSLVYNRGNSLKGDRRQEMANIGEHVRNEQYERIPAEFRSMKRIWAGRGLAGLIRRREAEAKLFEMGLTERERVVVVPPLPEPGLRPVGDADVDTLDTGVPVTPIFDPNAPAPASVAQYESLGEGRPPDNDGDGDTFPDDDYDESIAPTPLDLERAEIWQAVNWIEDDDLSTEYGHIRKEDRSLSGCTFDLLAQDLDLLIRANRFEPLKANGKIVFGLRGCLLEGTTPEEVSAQTDRRSLRLRETRPDHKNFRCVIGVYDLTTGLLSGFIASTVPNRWAVSNYKTNGTSGNLMPTGCYRYKVGRHSRNRFPGCLRQDQMTTVVRSRKNLMYDIADVFDPCWAFDNIHPAFRDKSGSSEFSSFGCQVIRGSCTAYTDNHTGEWAQFRKAAGLTAPMDGDSGKVFTYVLVTGLEAAVASKMRESGAATNPAEITASVGRLRQGSKGQEVYNLQAAMELSPDGIFGPNTRAKLADFQVAQQFASTSIFSPQMDEALDTFILRPKPLWSPPRPVTDDDIDTLDTGIPSPPLDAGEEIVVGAATAAGGGTLLERAGAGTLGLSGLDHLYLELARRAKAAESDPNYLSARSLLPLENYNPASVRAAVDYGRAVFARFEPAIHDLLCGDSAREMGDRKRVVARLNAAAGSRPEDLQLQLSDILLSKLFMVPPMNALVAQIVIERFMKPVQSGAATAAGPFVTRVCRSWNKHLDGEPEIA